jgi:hypothetical protein
MNNSDPFNNLVLIKLNTQYDWDAWYSAFKFNAKIYGVWEQCDPDAALEDAPEAPSATEDTIIEYLKKQRNADAGASTAAEGSTAYEPSVEEIKAEMERRNQLKQEAQKKAQETNSRTDPIWKWILHTVDPNRIETVLLELNNRNLFSVRAVVYTLRSHLAPAQSVNVETAREVYKNVMDKAQQGSVRPDQWAVEWHKAMLRGKQYNIPEVEGITGIKYFLQTVSKRLAPAWGEAMLINLSTQESMNEKVRSLDEYARMFNTAIASLNPPSRPGIFATLGESTNNKEPSTSPKNKNKGKKNGGGGVENECPCGGVKRKETHKWPPSECDRLAVAVTGQPIHAERKFDHMKTEFKVRVWKRLHEEKWNRLRNNLQSAGWVLANPGKDGADDAIEYRNITATVLNLQLFQQQSARSVFFTADKQHPLVHSTLLDNCGAMHIVNDFSLLEKDSIVHCEGNESVEAGGIALPISAKGKRVIRGAFRFKNGRGTGDLSLDNVAVVEGFPVNIVSEVLLGKSGVWYCGLDYTLRMGKSVETSEIVRSLIQKFNVVFFEYKPLAIYLLPCSDDALRIRQPRLIATAMRGQEQASGAFPLREDTEDLWHARTGHLGSEALRRLVQSARGVRIKGTQRIQCEHCSITHAQRVISSRRSENRAIRPFFRICWDLFDFPRAFDGAKWALVIKDEFSGKLFCFTLTEKSTPAVEPVIRDFEGWVHRQFGLLVCKIRQDNDRATISLPHHRSSSFEVWAESEGIDLETPPVNTHEPNGGAERAGQEVITKSIKMRVGANLPESLWPEVTKAAVWLYNMSPSTAHGMRSPNEVILQWFRGNFRFVEPSMVNARTRDLRPNWNGIFAYGCRAYPLLQERAAGLDRRGFKVLPRGHIGYLVGYRATNIYRIWVPSLSRVISTRDVRFDEHTFYTPNTEGQVGQPVEVLRALIETLNVPVSQDVGVVEQELGGLDFQREREEPEPETTPDEEAEAESSIAAPEGEVVSQDSGVEAQNNNDARGKGLITPEQTPGPDYGVIQPSERAHGQLVPSSSDERSTSPADSAGNYSFGGETTTPSPERHQEGGGNGETPVPTTEEDDDFYSAKSSSSSSESQSDEDLPPPMPPTRARGRGRGRARSRAETRQPTRSSRRLAGQTPGNQAMAVLLTDMIYTDSFIEFDTLKRPSPSEFPLHFSTLVFTCLPEQQKAIAEGARTHKTVHAVFAAATRHAKGGRTHRNELHKLPKNYKGLENHPLRQEFLAAMDKEIGVLKEKNTWRVISRTNARTRPLPLKWVYTYKFDKDGYLDRVKARICVRGDLQEQDSLVSTYAATNY